MRYFIEIDEVHEKIVFLEKKVNVIRDNIEYLEKIKNDLNWKGEAATVFHQNFNNYLKNLKNTEAKIVNCINFLLLFYDKYSEEYSSIKKRFNDFLDREVRNGLL